MIQGKNNYKAYCIQQNLQTIGNISYNYESSKYLHAYSCISIKNQIQTYNTNNKVKYYMLYA